MIASVIPNPTGTLRFLKVTPVEAHFEEFLTYNFGDITENSVIAFLHWEKLKVPFQIIL